MNLDKLKDKKILILGMAKEGLDTFEFLRKLFPKKVLGLADRSEAEKLGKEVLKIKKTDKRTKFYLGENYLKALKNYEVIIKSPGIPIHFPEIEKAFKAGKITSQTEIFFDNWPPERREGAEMKASSEGGKLHRPGTIIAITGTKGKGTASSLIYGVLKACPERKRRVHLVGNIGNPGLSFLSKSGPKDIFVYELSSHQAYNLQKSPHIAVFLNVFPAHLDFFKNFKEYSRAKENIALHQKKGDSFIYFKDAALLEKTAGKTKAKKISFSLRNRKADCYVKNGYVFYENEKIFKTKNSPLKGEFNLLNIMPGIIIGRLFNISSEKIALAIKNFKTMPYRLEYVGSFSGIKFYNDSLATIPEATISAIKAFGRELQTIILGGFDSGLNYKNLAKEILESRVKNLIFFPPTGKKIYNEIMRQKIGRSGGGLNYFFVDRAKRTSFSSSPSLRYRGSGAQYMKEAVSLAFRHTKKRKICLLSPAAPSFGIFRDYKERGDSFEKYIKNYHAKRKKTS